MPGFPKLMRFQEHHDNILKKYLPKIRRHFVSERLPKAQHLFVGSRFSLAEGAVLDKEETLCAKMSGEYGEYDQTKITARAEMGRAVQSLTGHYCTFSLFDCMALLCLEFLTDERWLLKQHHKTLPHLLPSV